MILQQAKDAQSQYENTAYIKIVAFATHCPCIGQGYQYTAYIDSDVLMYIMYVLYRIYTYLSFSTCVSASCN